ncbi:MAG: matrixin family metalloprotease, partial [Planctomycetota bacterium]
MRLGRLALQGLIVVILVGSAGLEADVYIGGSWQQPVEYWLNPNFEGEFVGNASDQLRELQCGVEAWFQQTGIDADLVYRGETDIAGFNSEDGINVTSWTPGDGGDALAGTIVSGEGDTIQGFDVVFFERFLETVPIRWSTAGEPSTGTIDIRGVATHEFGHVLGLGHSRDEDATMYPSARLRGLPLRSLSPIDRNCVEELYGHRGSPDPAPWIDDGGVV